MARHDSRDHRGRFTSSRAPIPSDDGQGDNSVYENVSSPSADPLGEHDQPAGTVYAQRPQDPAHGGYQQPIPHRRQVVIDAQTGEALSDHITDVREVDRLLGSQQRQAAHLAAAKGDPFATNLMSPMTGPDTREYAHLRNPRRLPPMGATDEPPYDTGHPDPIFR